MPRLTQSTRFRQNLLNRLVKKYNHKCMYCNKTVYTIRDIQQIGLSIVDMNQKHIICTTNLICNDVVINDTSNRIKFLRATFEHIIPKSLGVVIATTILVLLVINVIMYIIICIN